MNRRSFLKRLVAGIGIAAGVSVIADRVRAVNQHLPSVMLLRPTGLKYGFDPNPPRYIKVGEGWERADIDVIPSWEDIKGSETL